ncbi:MAG: response regulator [Myxococcales bacterium]
MNSATTSPVGPTPLQATLAGTTPSKGDRRGAYDGTPTVLLADDDPVVMEALREDLESENYRLLTADSGAECLRLLETEPVDVLLLDLVMPGISGFEVLKRLSASETKRFLPVLVLSASNNEVVRALKAGAVDYLTKPWQPEELLARVRTYVRLRERELQLADTVERLNERTRELENEIAERRRAEAQLVMASRMSSVGVVAAGVAHEINNPLTYLIGNLELLCSRLDSSPASAPLDRARLARMAEQAREGAERVRIIVRDLKTFSRPDSEELERVNLGEVIDSVLRLAGHELKHRASVTRDQAAVPPVLGNAGRLSQVLLNVVANAAQAMDQGTPATNNLHIASRVTPDGRMVEVRLKDNGIGMDPHSLAHAFDLFYTTKAGKFGRTGGTGLGLSLCRKIVEGFGGSISLQSEPNKGTEVSIFLPVFGRESGLLPGPGLVGHSASVTSIAPHSAARRLLVIDDEAEIGTLVAALLNDTFEVRVVHDAQEALHILRSGEQLQVVLCDLMMSGYTGMDLFDIVEHELPQYRERFVFMTGGACTSRARTFASEHAERVLEKPFSLEQLKHALDRASNQES